MPYKDKEKQKQKVAEWREKNRDKCAEYTKTWAKNNPDKVKRKWKRDHLRKKYGITLEHYENMIESQNELCPICKQPLDGQIDVDHCHETDIVRGVLHNHCNRLLACCRDNIQILANAIDYLKKYQSKSE